MEVPDNIEDIAPHLNKKHGGGPRTDAGRARSAMNACKDHIFTQIDLLPQEHREQFNNLHEGMRAELKPRTIVEECLVRDLAEAQFRKGRILNAETKAIKHADDKGDSPATVLERLGRYSGTLSRQFITALKTLKEHQHPRLEHMRDEWRQAVLIRDFYLRQGIDWDPAVDEFVFSKEQVDQQIKFNKQWGRFVQKVIIYPTTKYQDERFLQKAL